MWRLIRWLLILFAISAVVLVGYAFFADLQPPAGTIVIPIEIPAD